MKRKTLVVAAGRVAGPLPPRAARVQRSSSMLLPTRDKLAMLADALQRWAPRST